MAKPSILTLEFPDTEDRAEFITAKFAGIFQDNTVFPKILEHIRVDAKNSLLLGDRDEVSEYWFNWVVHSRAWRKAMALGKLDHFAAFQADKMQPFPWPSVPSSDLRNPSDRAAWFPKFKEAQVVLANLTSRERLERGLVLMKEQPPLKRSSPGMSSIGLRQAIWDDIFPEKPCAKGRPFEFAAPSHLKFVNHVCADIPKWREQLPPGIRIGMINAECPEGKPVNGLVFGYEESTIDNPWNRLLLGLVYKTAIEWAREVFMTRNSTPLSLALKNIKVSSILNGDHEQSEQMKRLSLDKSLVAECDAQLALAPYRTEKEDAAYRVAAWLEKEKLLPAEERCRMLRGWCDQPHVNLESLTPADQRMACQCAWEGKSKEWAEAKPPLYLSWSEEKKFAAEIAK